VHLLETETNLLEPGCSLLRGEFLLLLDVAEETAALHILHDDVKVREVIEETVEFDDVGVVQEHLDLDLVDELLQHVLHFLLRHLLDGYQHLAGFVDGGEYLPERPLAFAAAQLEVTEG